ncbi:hypothetical protein, partial [uncultured Brevundimonas sp.]|uniref:hypothetical protein n=1 Tax=uncultured Brevundimonas sp. TaxID=213418 RepID=UPI0025E378F2
GGPGLSDRAGVSGMTRRRHVIDDDLLDEGVWDVPRRLSEDDLYAQDGPGWRRAPAELDDLEDGR